MARWIHPPPISTPSPHPSSQPRPLRPTAHSNSKRARGRRRGRSKKSLKKSVHGENCIMGWSFPTQLQENISCSDGRWKTRRKKLRCRRSHWMITSSSSVSARNLASIFTVIMTKKSEFSDALLKKWKISWNRKTAIKRCHRNCHYRRVRRKRRRRERKRTRTLTTMATKTMTIWLTKARSRMMNRCRKWAREEGRSGGDERGDGACKHGSSWLSNFHFQGSVPFSKLNLPNNKHILIRLKVLNIILRR